MRASTGAVREGAEPRETIWALQYLRGFAALLVVLFHSGVYQALLRNGDINTLNVGAIGVDVFFVLSGFIILYVTEQQETPLRFIAKRAVRILPMLWASVTIYAVAALWIPGSTLVRSPEHFVASLFLWGVFVDGQYIDQAIGVAWTLRFEIVFYLAMAAAVAISHRYRAYIAGVMLLLVTAAAQYAPDSAIAPFAQARNWHPGFYEFLYGMMIFHVWKDFKFSNRAKLSARRSLAAVGSLTLLSVFILVPFAANGILAAPIHHKHLAWGLPALAVFCLWMLPLQRVSLTGPAHSIPALLGDASYAIYLLHSLALTLLTWVEPLRSFWLSQSYWLAVAINFSIATLFGCAGHLLVERPLLAWILPLVRRQP